MSHTTVALVDTREIDGNVSLDASTFSKDARDSIGLRITPYGLQVTLVQRTLGRHGHATRLSNRIPLDLESRRAVALALCPELAPVLSPT